MNPPPPPTIWSFDLGKASIGEAVREANKPHFIHKASLLIPAELARRGPAWVSGTPASKHRALKTREAHKHREAWLDEVWAASPGLTPLVRRTVAVVGGEQKEYKKRVRGKVKVKTRTVGGKWKLVCAADPRLEKEFAGEGDATCFTSCLLRIKLLNPKTLAVGESLAEWQIYKALFSAMQKRGYGDVPWKEQRKGGGEETKSEQEQAEDALADKRWQDFVAELEKAGLGDGYRRACYFDAFHMKLWSPSSPDVVALHPTDRPESTRKVVFRARDIEAEIFALAQNAAALLKVLEKGYVAQMKKYRDMVDERIARANAYRAQHGKKLVTALDFSRGAENFAELLVYGPGGNPKLANGVRPIASANPAIRRATGLRPGSPDDRMGVVSQGTARFENRLRSDCALIPRLSCCRNLGAEEFSKITDDNDPKLLPAQVTLLMKLKNMRVQEITEGRPQRGLKHSDIGEIFAALNPKRKYHLTKTEWRKWCKTFDVLPVLDSHDKAKPGAKAADEAAVAKKSKDDDAVEKPSTQGRSRYSRPALRIVRELVLSGDAPSVFHARLLRREPELLAKLGTKQKKEGKIVDRRLEISDDSADAKVNVANGIKGLLVSDLAALLRMRKDDATTDSWEDLYIPSQQLDRLAQQSSATREERDAAIRALIGQQNNPIVRHRLDTFWKRLRALEAMKGSDGQPIGEPHRMIIEMVRDDSETSWLGQEAVKEITLAQKKQRERRDNARDRLTEMGQPHGDVLKYLLWEAQGGQCLYGKEVKSSACAYTATSISFTDIAKCRVDHIVPRAMGGPDSFSNKILTTDETNARKGDRTPYQWFRQDRTTEDWDAYRNRVSAREFQLGAMKTRLLLSADSETLVSRYTPLAETAWITRLAQTVAGLHFGWANGNDAKGDKRVIVVSGGLTGRIRRRYHLDSLLGADGTLDGEVTTLLREQASLRAELAALPQAISESDARYPRLKEIKSRLREVRDLLGEKAREAEKHRDDLRHHALDALVLNCCAGWMNDPNREDEIRLEDLGDAPCYASEQMQLVKQVRSEIIARQALAAKAKTLEDRERLQREITKRHDALASLRQPPNVMAVRERLRKEIAGDEAAKILPVLPRHLHFPKPQLEATFHRGVWVRVEDEKKAETSTVENFDEAFAIAHKPVALVDFAYVTDWRTRELYYCRRQAARMAQSIAPHTNAYDAHAARGAVQHFLKSKPDEAQWRAWCENPSAPAGIKLKKSEPPVVKFKVYKLEERRTKAVPLASLPMPGTDDDEVEDGQPKKPKALVDDYQRDAFLKRLDDLVIPPPRVLGKKAKAVVMPSSVEPSGEVRPNIELQDKLRSLEPTIAAFYQQHSPNHGKAPRKGTKERQMWEENRRAFFSAEKGFFTQHGIDIARKFAVKNPTDKVQDKPWKMEKLRRLILVQIPSYSRVTALKKIKGLTDPWTRFQLWQFLRSKPELAEWRAFCAVFTQVERDEYRVFLSSCANSPTEFIEFYGKLRRKILARSVITHVHKRVGKPDQYVDVSKDGSGIYAKGGNRGYLMWKRTVGDEVTFGAEPVLGSQKLADAKKRLLNEDGIALYDEKLWRSGMLLRLPRDTQSGKKLVPAGHYHFGSVSNGVSATLKPLVGGDIFDGISVAKLLANGLQRVD